MQNFEQFPGVIPWTPVLGDGKRGEVCFRFLKMYQNFSMQQCRIEDSNNIPRLLVLDEKEEEWKFVFFLQK